MGNIFIFIQQGEGSAHRIYKYIGKDELIQGYVLRVPKVDFHYSFFVENGFRSY